MERNQKSMIEAQPAANRTHAVVLPGEDRAGYDDLRRDLMTTIDPSDPIQVDLVEVMCRSLWCTNRAVRYLTGLLTEAMEQYGPEIREEYPEIADRILGGASFKRTGG